MAASLLALLSQQTPNLTTRKGLILTGLQHDFLSPDGKLPVSNVESGFLERTKTLINEFREHGQIIWVRTEVDGSTQSTELSDDAYNVITLLDQHKETGSEDDSENDASESETAQSSRKRKSGRDTSSPIARQGTPKRQQRRSSLSDDEESTGDPSLVDEEHFLTKTADRDACFIKGTAGADFAASIKSLVEPKDLQVVKSCYSAFSSTSLLSTLRMKLITELYVCGAMTNLNVYATAMDAASHGIKITLVEDCLGYRIKERHDLAIKRLVNIMEAKVAISAEVIAALKGHTAAPRSKVTEVTTTHTTLGAEIDVAADILEVASSDDEDDEDLLSVRASPYQSHRPLEIRGSRPKGKDLQAGDTGPKPHSELQRHASAESDASPSASQRQAKDNIERPSEIQAIELKVARNVDQSQITGDATGSNATSQPLADTIEVNLSDPSHRVTVTQEGRVSETLSPKSITKQSTAPVQSTSTKSRKRNRKAQSDDVVGRQAGQPLFGLGKEEESSGSSIQYDLLPPDRGDGLFHRLKEEVTWQKMHHQTGEVPRLVCCQGTIDVEGNMPVYRHPSDETIALLPWTTTVDEIRRAAEVVAGHALNHALIQLYRAGTDFISEHSDKTLDIRPDSFIVNASFGAERVMRLRTKRAKSDSKTAPRKTTPAAEQPPPPPQDLSRTTHRVRLPHNSALLMSLKTNAQYLHSINADKRPAAELTAAEKAYDGQRISLTFRQIGTFLDAKSEYIWGQGATGKERVEARRVVASDAAEVEKLVRGFGKENAAAEIEWAECYGEGSDVLHLK